MTSPTLDNCSDPILDELVMLANLSTDIRSKIVYIQLADYYLNHFDFTLSMLTHNRNK